MYKLKIRAEGGIKRSQVQALEWEQFTACLYSTLYIGNLARYRIVSNRPLSGLVITGQDELDLVKSAIEQDGGILDINVEYQKTSFLNELLAQLVSTPENREFLESKLIEYLQCNPTVNTETIVPGNFSIELKTVLRELFDEAKAKQKVSPFKLVYVREGGKLVLKPQPNSEWINYSNVSIETLSKTLPAAVIRNLKSVK